MQPSTYSIYKYTLKLLNKHFGREKLSEILPLHITLMLNRLVDEGYSKSQISKCRTMLIQIFDAAEDNGLVARTPARKTKPIKNIGAFVRASGSEKDAFTEAEVEILFSTLPHDLLGHSVRLMLLTGMRVQELLALTEEDIAEDGSSVRIDKAIKTVDNKAMLGPPKSKHSNRTVPVPKGGQISARFLREHGGTPFIWSSSAVHPLHGVGTFRRKYYAVLREIAGVRALSPHACRHTYITRLQAKGVGMEIIARLAGHGEMSTTDGYLHIAPDTFRNAIEVLDSEQDIF